jgi:Ser/Thr protein kinase RdoA (MazF antagonist)
MKPVIAHALGEAATHGMDAGTAAPDWAPLSIPDIGALAPHFPELSAPERLLWHSPRPFSSAARVQTAAGEWFVKRHDARVRDVRGLLEEHGFIAHLGARGVPVPAVRRSAAGATALALGSWTYEVHALAPGVDAYRDAHSWTPARSTAHARALGRALAQLHLAAQGYEAPARAVAPLVGGFDIVGSADLPRALDAYLEQRPAVTRFLDGAARDRMLAVLGPWHATLRPLLPELGTLWVHNDWHASNLFWTDRSTEAQVRAIIDFGLCNRGCAVADLATALERNTIAWLDQPSEGADGGNEVARDIGRAPLALALLEGYASIRALNVAERHALPALMALAHVEFALSEVDYFHGVVANEDNARLAYPGFLLGHVRWFEGRHGREYLAALRGAIAAR